MGDGPRRRSLREIGNVRGEEEAGSSFAERKGGRPFRPSERPVVQQVLLRDEYYLRTREGRQVVEMHSERKESTLKKEGEMGLGGVGGRV